MAKEALLERAAFKNVQHQRGSFYYVTRLPLNLLPGILLSPWWWGRVRSSWAACGAVHHGRPPRSSTRGVAARSPRALHPLVSLAGGPILGRYTGVRAGHTLTNKLLRALFARPDAFVWVECDAASLQRLPGVGVSLADLDAVA